MTRCSLDLKTSFSFLFLEEPVVLKRPPIVDTIPTNVRPVAREKSNLDNKLERLEKLQYALTRQVKDERVTLISVDFLTI